MHNYNIFDTFTDFYNLTTKQLPEITSSSPNNFLTIITILGIWIVTDFFILLFYDNFFLYYLSSFFILFIFTFSALCHNNIMLTFFIILRIWIVTDFFFMFTLIWLIIEVNIFACYVLLFLIFLYYFVISWSIFCLTIQNFVIFWQILNLSLFRFNNSHLDLFFLIFFSPFPRGISLLL